MTIKVIDSTVTATTVAVESATVKLKATFTNLVNGVSLQEERIMVFGIQVQWTVVDREEGPHSTEFLEENVRVSCVRVVDRFLNFVDGFNPKTKFLVEFLGKVASGEISMDDVKFMTREYSDPERLKEE